MWLPKNSMRSMLQGRQQTGPVHRIPTLLLAILLATVAASCTVIEADIDLPERDCGPGTRVEYDDALMCLFCLAETPCPRDIEHRLAINGGILCSDVLITPAQVPVEVEYRIERRCAGALDGGVGTRLERVPHTRTCKPG